ncbi:uncharacterized protein LOC122077552 [Macadamia integrifolia]|uniref:uncharacterized protein LOC122077552 n=1 Tax=Macadamia integrifolia TaxID=60698 RepID=UPI001C4F7D4C|nr:uncharacterized protein LOC122077552 [Macadamia integrifolia]
MLALGFNAAISVRVSKELGEGHPRSAKFSNGGAYKFIHNWHYPPTHSHHHQKRIPNCIFLQYRIERASLSLPLGSQHPLSSAMFKLFSLGWRLEQFVNSIHSLKTPY